MLILLFVACAQTLSNRGAKPIAAPYTLEVHYKGYLSANTPWHWGVSNALKVSNGVVSGPVTLVSHLLLPLKDTSAEVF